MITVTMLNQKGGVGKTSCTLHLAGSLASAGFKILLLDNDPQSSLTQGFWGPNAARSIDPGETIAALYRGDEPFPDLVIKPTGIEGIDILPGSRAATTFNVPDPELADLDRQLAIRTFLATLDSNAYDLAMIDCPPNLHLCTWSALAASDYLIVPTQPEDFGAQGLYDVQESVGMVRASLNPSLKLLGYLLTRVSKTKTVHQIYEETLRSRYGREVFLARMPDAVGYIEAIAAHMPVSHHKPKSAPAKAIQEIALELLFRVEASKVMSPPVPLTYNSEVA